jgi:hypothetical protein
LNIPNFPYREEAARVNDNAKAKQELKSRGFTVGKTDVVAVEVTDQPGGLHHILEILQKAGVNVEYMYAFVQQSGADAVSSSGSTTRTKP